jgi:hypothetical protein
MLSEGFGRVSGFFEEFRNGSQPCGQGRDRKSGSDRHSEIFELSPPEK